jgi:colanic acid/amylovoran biosynthesis glycosyltransferase
MSLAGRHIAVVTERFPNLVQPYILNQLLSLQGAGARLTIISGLLQAGDRRHLSPAARGLLGRVRYIGVNGAGELASQLASYLRPGYSLARVGRAARRAVAAGDWRRHGLKYFVKELAKLRLLSEAPFDLVHSHFLGGSYEYLFLKEVFSIPVMTTFHGLPPRSAKMVAADKMARVFRAGDLFLVNTRFARGQLQGLGCAERKIAILPQGSDLSQLHFAERRAPADGRFVVLSVARLSPDKGLKHAIRAARKLSDRYPQLEYQIVGEGPQRAELEAEIAALGAGGCVKLVGAVGDEELRRRYHKAHLFVLPSVRARDGYHEETQGVVIQEAQATGLPVVTTRVGGIPECVVDGETGLLVEERDPAGLAGAVQTLLADWGLARRLARNGRRFVEDNFDQRKISERLFNLYESLLDSDAPRGARAQATG